MSEYDRGKIYPKKKFFSPREKESPGHTKIEGRSYSGNKNESPLKSTSNISEPPKKQPTILLKAREPHVDDVAASPKRYQKEETSNSLPKDDVNATPSLRTMTKSMKLIDEGIICTESLQDYFNENNEFLVVGVVGAHGVGKSTVMNLLSHSKLTETLKQELFKTETSSQNLDSDIKILTDHLEKIDLQSEEKLKPEIFKIETVEDIERGFNRTQGIDIFATSNRLILLDCQPVASISVLEELIKSETKRTNLVSEFIPLENSGEIQGLQLTAFLMSTCHVLLLVQDWFFDSNIIRFLHSAEMLKPTIPNPEDELTDHFPHLMIVHNRAQMEDFSPTKFKTMQEVYQTLFSKSKLNLKSEMGLGTGRLISYLNSDNCGNPINLFMIPEIDLNSHYIYSGHPPLEELVAKFRANILGSTRNPLTHVQLTERTWLLYCAKVWDTVKKSPFFVEYTKLMP
ncbi:nonsense-mediated mRNA decay factor SMG9 [Diorhabda carinulata]|uniref:nonsense-mediated mRNA decay factor SMG9 n=1 Tax=Diorhabda carinulata TaxID=1163345 RepID=UPI0025A17CC7|nr:nonsense-mediated mRNA decay factor SMG9 [Diorhabda carinulata]